MQFDIISFGKTGEQIVEQLQNLQYECSPYFIKISNKSSKDLLKIKKQHNIEDYENNFPKINPKKMADDLLVILSPSDEESFCALPILEQLQNKKISILYIQPDHSFCSNSQVKFDGILKERLQMLCSIDLLDSMFLYSVNNIKNVLSDITILNYFEKIYSSIAYSFFIYKFSQQSKPIFDSQQFHINSSLPKNAKFCSFSLFDLNDFSEKNFYFVDKISDKRYILFIQEEEIKSDKNLMQKIQNITNNSNDHIRKHVQVFSSELSFNMIANFSSTVGI